MLVKAATTVYFDNHCFQNLQVTAIAFSFSTSFPPGCFGSTLAKATVSNVQVLRDWIRNLHPSGTYAQNYFKIIIRKVNYVVLMVSVG